MNKYININHDVLKTKRLTLRPWRQSDLADLNEYARVDGVGQPAGWLPHKSMEESKFILDMFMAEAKTFAIEYEGKAIGSVGIEEYDEDLFCDLADLQGRELGFALSKDCWNRGIMTEAVEAVIKYAFDELKLDFLVCGRMAENARSGRVQEKCGFIPCRTKERKNVHGETTQGIYSLLTKEDWLKKTEHMI